MNGDLSGTGYDAQVDGQSGQQIVQDVVLGAQGTPQSFDIPVLTDPSEAVKLLLGADANLFSLNLPTIDLNWPVPIDATLIPAIPGFIIPGLSLDLQATAGITADLAFGYDTRGLEQFIQSVQAGNPIYSDVFNGFYLGDGAGPEFTLAAEISLLVELGLGQSIPGLTIGGGGTVAGEITLDVNDDLNGSPVDGKLYYDELSSALATDPFQIFDAGGLIQAGFTAFVEVFGYDVWRYNSPRITLGSINFSDDPNVQAPAGLAEASAGNPTELQLNLGSFARRSPARHHAGRAERRRRILPHYARQRGRRGLRAYGTLHRLQLGRR